MRTEPSAPVRAIPNSIALSLSHIEFLFGGIAKEECNGVKCRETRNVIDSLQQ
jgi:hypothetical protein